MFWTRIAMRTIHWQRWRWAYWHIIHVFAKITRNQCSKCLCLFVFFVLFEFPKKNTYNVAFWVVLANMNFLSENNMYAWVVSARFERSQYQVSEHVAMPHTRTHTDHELYQIVCLFAVCFASIGYFFASSWFPSIDTFNRFHFILTHSKVAASSRLKRDCFLLCFSSICSADSICDRKAMVCYHFFCSKWREMSFGIISHANWFSQLQCRKLSCN